MSSAQDSSVLVTDAFRATIFVKRGVMAMRRNAWSEAIVCMDHAIKLEPDYALAHWNKATSLLSLGNYIDGFKEFEWRWNNYDWCRGLLGEHINRIREWPQWNGEDLSGKRVLFYWEMGFGDAIQQLRYVPVLQALGAKVTALMPPPLARLARLLGVEVIEQLPGDASAFDFFCSLFSVMVPLKQTVDTLPIQPYLPMKRPPPRGKMGLAWAGRTITFFAERYFVSHIKACKDHQLQSLVPGESIMAALPAGDFLDTMRVIEQMEHVISVDTAVAHLAGAMGHPSVHVLIPYNSDWRWNFGSAWYPKMKMYKQTRPEDWDEPLATLNGVLQCRKST